MAGVRNFAPARIQGTGVPTILDLVNAAAQTYKLGALVLVNGSGLLAECGADPTLVAGVALSPPASYPGYSAANSPTVITGAVDHTPIAVANDSTIFSCRGVNGATDPAVPVRANIGVSYAVGKDANGVWYLDVGDTANTVCYVVDIDINNNLFYVKFIASVQQL